MLLDIHLNAILKEFEIAAKIYFRQYRKLCNVFDYNRIDFTEYRRLDHSLMVSCDLTIYNLRKRNDFGQWCLAIQKVEFKNISRISRTNMLP